MKPDTPSEEILIDLVRLLNQGAPADEFSKRLAHVEALPSTARKSSLVEVVRMAMAVRNRLEFQQQRERGMLAVTESAQDLSSRLDLNSLLRTIVARARHLLGSHIAWLSIYDPETCEFKAQATDGALAEMTLRMKAARPFGVAGAVMTTRMPFATSNYLQDTRFLHDPALDDNFRIEGIIAFVGVPLIWEEQVIGLLFVGDRYHRTHDALSISILSTLATHAAVAIRNAMAFEEASVALRKAEAARVELEQYTRNIHAAAEAHGQLTSLLAKGASLSDLCESVAQLLDGRVLIVDEASQLIGGGAAAGYGGASAEIYDPHGPRSLAIQQALNESRRAGRSIMAFEADGESCRVVAVIGGNDVLGAVLLFRRGELDELSIRTFERSATVIGVVLLSQERIEAAKTRDASSLLRDLVSFRQDEPALMRDRAERFGLDLSRPMSLLLLEVDALKGGYVARRLRTGVPIANVLVDEIDGVTALLCSATQAQQTVELLTSLVRSEFGAGFRGVVSKPVRAVEEIPALCASLRRAINVLERIGVNGHIVGQNEMALYSVLFETHDSASLSAFLKATIGELIALDEKRGSDLLVTLLKYFDHNQNAKKTAAHLGIHVNTIHQRLASIEAVLGNWGQATRALEIHIALRLWHLSQPHAEVATRPG